MNPNNTDPTIDARQSSSCPDSATLALFLNEALTISHDRDIGSHIEKCPVCQAWLHQNLNKERPFYTGSIPPENFDSSRIHPPKITGFEFDDVHREGGQGVVFRAKDVQLNRYVAIKMMKSGYYAGDLQQTSLFREARAVARLSHPHIVKLYSLQFSETGPYLVMDWIEGGTLLDRLSHRLPTIDESLTLMIDLADATRHAHEHQILHRDIKPSNIMMDGVGFQGAKLTDFGLAKQGRNEGGWSSATDLVGTPVYMAPELFLGEPGAVGPHVDVYSLGALFYLLLTGRVPFQGSNPIDLGMKIVRQEVTPPRLAMPAIPKDLETICLKCLRKDPGERYPTAAALLEDLKRYRQGLPILASRETTLEKWRRWARREPLAATQLAGFIGFLFVTIVALGVLLERSGRNKRIAEERLSKTVEAMRISSPIFKRFLRELPANKDEINKIMNFARLRESISAEPADLKERLQFHYVTLELGDAIRHMAGFENESLELTMKARQKIAEFLSQNREKLANIVVFESKPDHFRYTLLEKTEIQYGHSCSQLFDILSKSGIADRLIEASPYLLEAIDHANIALKLNPALDEANINLANYHAALANVFKHKGDWLDGENSLKKSCELFYKLTDNEPRQMDRWALMLEYENQLAEYQLAYRKAPESYFVAMERIEQYLKDPRIQQLADRGSIEMKIIAIASRGSRIEFNQGRKEKALDILKSSISKLINMPSKPQNLREYENQICNMEIELMHLYYLAGADLAILRKEQSRIHREFESFHDAYIRNISIAMLYLLTPMPELRDTSLAHEKLKESSVNDAELIHLKQILELRECDMQTAEAYRKKYFTGEGISLGILNNQILGVELAETFYRLHQPDRAKEMLAWITPLIEKQPHISPIIKAKVNYLQLQR